MNIQSTGNSYSIQSTYKSNTSESQEHTASKYDSSTLTRMKSSKEVRDLESQGVPLSIGEEQLMKALDRAIKALEGPSTMFEMKVHEPTHSIIVKVINKETGETIREIPPEKTLDLVVKMMEFAGILIDERV